MSRNVEIRGRDVYDPTTGAVRSSLTGDIAPALGQDRNQGHQPRSDEVLNAVQDTLTRER